MTMYTLIGIFMALTCAMCFALCVSLLLNAAWPLLRRLGGSLGPVAESRFWFLVAATPAMAAVMAALLTALPSYIRYEPQPAERELGALLWLTTAIAIGIMLRAAWNFTRSAWLLSRMSAALTNDCFASGRMRNASYALVSKSGVLAVFGLFRQRILVSEQIERMLHDDELAGALAHEDAHAEAHHNFVRLLLCFALDLAAFAPFKRRVEQSWREAIEMAADLAAIRRGNSAVALSSALVKVSRQRMPGEMSAHLVSTFAPQRCSHLERRVRSLLAYCGDEPKAASPRFGVTLLGFAVGPVFLLTLAFFLSRTPVLAGAHHVLEAMMR